MLQTNPAMVHMTKLIEEISSEVRFTSKANISSKVNIVSTQKLDVGFVPSKSPSKEPKLAATHRCGFLYLRNMSNVSEDGSISIRHLPESLS